jgi:hypothetical protein
MGVPLRRKHPLPMWKRVLDKPIAIHILDVV